jgi:hypothetical protein
MELINKISFADGTDPEILIQLTSDDLFNNLLNLLSENLLIFPNSLFDIKRLTIKVINTIK